MKTNRALSKIIAIALVLSFIFSMASCSFFTGSLKLESFTVDRSTVKTVYIVGEEIDFSGIQATAIYTDESLNKVYTFSELTITYDPDITAAPGQKTVSVSFYDENLGQTVSANVQITVNEDPNALKHASYRIDASAVKTAYVVGEPINFDGIKVFEKFSDNSEVEITDLSQLSFTPALDGLTDTAGNKVVKVQYNGEDAGTITVKVSDPEIEKNDLLTVVVGGSYKTTYEVGEAVDLAGLTLTLTYEDGDIRTLTADAVTPESVDMTTPGSKTVVLSFIDPINEEEDFTSITITVILKYEVEQFEKPTSITAFESDNKSAGTLQYGSTGFQGQFLKGSKTYKVGDDNEWKFVPSFAYDNDGVLTSATSFNTNVDLYVLVGEEYVLLNKTPDADRPNIVTYTNADGGVIAVVDTYRGSYDFTDDAIGNKIKLSVLPSANEYKLDGVNPITFEVEVIDAYNVYEAWQLAVIDNDTSRSDWNTLKAEKGIAGVDPAGVVIHSDIHISASDVPETFFYVSDKEVTYTKTVNGVTETSVAPVGTKYLVDTTSIYSRTGTPSFRFEGNFFAIDTRNFPLVASPAVFDESLDRDYGSDYSNATLFHFAGTHNPWTIVDTVYVEVNNLALVGNAARDNWVDANGNLVTAGGVIMLKSTGCADVTMNNTINNSFFIAYFPDYTANLTVNDSKAFDSYQNSAFVWSDSVFTVNNSYMVGSGGPNIIAMSKKIDGTQEYRNPVVIIDGSVVETHVSGEEVWFKSVGATTIVGDMKALGNGLNQLVSTAGSMMGLNLKADWTDSNGQMCIRAALMPAVNNANDLADGMIQGTVHLDGCNVDRWYDPTSPNFNMEWATILQHPAFALGAPFMTVTGADGTNYTIYYANGAFFDMNNNQIGADLATQAAIIQALATADQIVLHQGGLSVVFELYH